MTDQKTKKPRKRRVDSKEAAVEAMVAQKVKVIEPPSDLDMTKDDLKSFDEVINEFAKVDWTDHTIRLAAMLARSLTLFREAQDSVREEGFTVTTARGGTGMNPCVSAMNMISGQIMTSRRTLALHAVAAANKGDVGKRRAQNKSNAEDAPEDDDLIAIPKLQVVK